MELAPPPLWQEWLFENPWPLVIVLLAVAVVVRLVATRNRRPRLNYAALAAAGLAAGVYLLTWAVHTDREQLIDRTVSLVAATAPLDMAALNELLADGAIVAGPQGDPWIEADRITSELEAVVRRHGGFEHKVRGLASQATSPVRGRTLLSLSTTAHSLGMPLRSRWLITWRKEGDDRWRVIEVRWLEFNDRPPQVGMWR